MYQTQEGSQPSYTDPTVPKRQDHPQFSEKKHQAESLRHYSLEDPPNPGNYPRTSGSVRATSMRTRLRLYRAPHASTGQRRGFPTDAHSTQSREHLVCKTYPPPGHGKRKARATTAPEHDEQVSSLSVTSAGWPDEPSPLDLGAPVSLITRPVHLLRPLLRPVPRPPRSRPPILGPAAGPSYFAPDSDVGFFRDVSPDPFPELFPDPFPEFFPDPFPDLFPDPLPAPFPDTNTSLPNPPPTSPLVIPPIKIIFGRNPHTPW